MITITEKKSTKLFYKYLNNKIIYSILSFLILRNIIKVSNKELERI